MRPVILRGSSTIAGYNGLSIPPSSESPTFSQEEIIAATSKSPRPAGLKLDRSLPILRNSERGTLKACEWRWLMTYERRLQPYTAAPALRFGSLVHAALARYYKPGIKRGTHPATNFLKFYEAELEEAERFGFKDEDGTWNEAGDLGVAMLENYVDEYGKDDEWEVIATEMPFHMLVNRPATKIPWFTIVGVLDGVWRNRSKRTIWIPDHKTIDGLGGTSQHPNIPVWLLMDDQAGTYWSYGVDYLRQRSILAPKQKLAGMLFNFLAKKMPDERPYKIVKGRRIYQNQDGTPSKRQPTPHFVRQQILRDDHDADYSKQRIADDFRRIELLREHALNPTKSPGRFTCPMCPVRDLCELHETGNDYESTIEAIMMPWDPYEQHEIQEGR